MNAVTKLLGAMPGTRLAEFKITCPSGRAATPFR